MTNADLSRIANETRALRDEAADARADAHDACAAIIRRETLAANLRKQRREHRRRLLGAARELVSRARSAPRGRFQLTPAIDDLRAAVRELAAFGGDTIELRRLLRELEDERRKEIEAASQPAMPATIVAIDLAGMPVVIVAPAGR